MFYYKKTTVNAVLGKQEARYYYEEMYSARP